MDVSVGFPRPFPWRRIVTAFLSLACIGLSIAFAVTTDVDWDGDTSTRVMRLAPVIVGLSAALTLYLWGSPIGSRAFGFRLTNRWRWFIAWIATIGWFLGMVAVSGWIVQSWPFCKGGDPNYWKLVESGAIPHPECGRNPAEMRAYYAALIGPFAIIFGTLGVEWLERRALLRSHLQIKRRSLAQRLSS